MPFERVLTTDIYPADFAWTPNWDDPDARIDKWYYNIGGLSEAGQALATYRRRDLLKRATAFG